MFWELQHVHIRSKQLAAVVCISHQQELGSLKTVHCRPNGSYVWPVQSFKSRGLKIVTAGWPDSAATHFWTSHFASAETPGPSIGGRVRRSSPWPQLGPWGSPDHSLLRSNMDTKDVSKVCFEAEMRPLMWKGLGQVLAHGRLSVNVLI